IWRYLLSERTVLLGAALLLVASVAEPANWPYWRGPDGNGVSTDHNLPVTWSPTQNVVWKTPMPAWTGSTPIVWGDRVFLNTAETNDLFLWCLDRRSGAVLWKQLVGGGNTKMRKQNMSSPSPVTDGRNVWVLTGTGALKAFDFAGKELWARDIQKD